VPLPPAISDRLAACVMTKGLTAHYLVFTTYAVKAGDTILVHAAAGGVGSILCQWARHLGARVIGAVGSEAKAEIARRHGCDHAILYAKEDLAQAVLRLTGGKGVPVVYDSVGKDSFEGSLRCLSPRALLVSFGTASGPIPAFDLFRLNALGSLYVTSPAFVTHTKERPELLARSRQLFQALEAGILRVEVGRSYPLAEARRAHEDLEARKTVGSNILVP
jgi:NADPH2:quinone reductase